MSRLTVPVGTLRLGDRVWVTPNSKPGEVMSLIAQKEMGRVDVSVLLDRGGYDIFCVPDNTEVKVAL